MLSPLLRGWALLCECNEVRLSYWAACDPGESYIDVAYHGFAVAASAEPDDYKYVGAIHDKLICYGIAQMKGEGDLEKSQASEKNQ